MSSHLKAEMKNAVLAENLNGAQGEVPTLSIVVPAYFEEGNLDLLHEKLLQVMEALNESWELIIVDDGCKDKTWEVIAQLSAKDDHVKGLRLSRNFGHQYSLFAGL